MSEFSEILDRIEEGAPAEFSRIVGDNRYIRKFDNPERLILLGGGHVSQALCEMAAMLDFEITVVDDRMEFANTERFPKAHKVICDAFDKALCDLKIRKTDYICILTRGHRWDEECLRRILTGTMPYYLGMIGSKRRVGGLFELLKEDGFDEKLLSEIHAPIGIKIGGITPQEISVSICAEMVACRHKNPALKGEILEQTNTDLSVLRFLAREDCPRAMMLVLESSGSTPVKSGSLMAIDHLGHGYGTIGGGCSEAAAIAQARRLIGTHTSKVIEVDMTNDFAAREGMVCGGRMSVLVEDLC